MQCDGESRRCRYPKDPSACVLLDASPCAHAPAYRVAWCTAVLRALRTVHHRCEARVAVAASAARGQGAIFAIGLLANLRVGPAGGTAVRPEARWFLADVSGVSAGGACTIYNGRNLHPARPTTSWSSAVPPQMLFLRARLKTQQEGPLLPVAAR